MKNKRTFDEFRSLVTCGTLRAIIYRSKFYYDKEKHFGINTSWDTLAQTWNSFNFEDKKLTVLYFGDLGQLYARSIITRKG